MLIQLCYTSTKRESKDLMADLSSILTEAIRSNQSQNICGVLYYARNSFFQCLEGEKETVENTFAHIKNDPRHTDIEVVSLKEIHEISFKHWSMKYVQKNKMVDQFFKSKNLKFFQPKLLNKKEIDEFITCLIQAEMASIDQKKSKKVPLKRKIIHTSTSENHLS